MQDPYLQATGVVMPLPRSESLQGDAGLAAGNPIQYSNAHARFDQPARALGADNAEIYGQLLGLTEAQQQGLQAQGVI